MTRPGWCAHSGGISDVLSPPRCSQDAGWAKLISDMFSTKKEILPLKISEDCLYLNIYSPADLTKSSQLPVSAGTITPDFKFEHLDLLWA